MPYRLRRDEKPQDYFTPEEKLVHAALHRAGYRGYDPSSSTRGDDNAETMKPVMSLIL